MEFYSDNLYQVVKKKEVTPMNMKLYAYQIFRALNYLTMLSISHRDMKPQNILVDMTKNKAIICDFWMILSGTVHHTVRIIVIP